MLVMRCLGMLVALQVALLVACEPSTHREDVKEPALSAARPQPPPPPTAAPTAQPPTPRRTADLPPSDAGPAVDTRPTRPDADVVRDIERTIRENGVLTAQGATVHVTCDKGEVTLRGVVKDEAARSSVNSMVRKTPGVLRINDLLKATDPHPTDWNPDDPKY